jgi:hypothetical protein
MQHWTMRQPQPRQTIGGSAKGHELLLGVLLFVVVWAVAVAICFLLVQTHRGHWVELFNGATWPTQFVERSADNRGDPIRHAVFYIVVGLRTVLNLGIVLTAGFVVYLLFTGQIKELLMSQLESVLTTRDVALAAYLMSKLEKDVAVNEDSLRRYYEAAGEFHESEAGREFLRSIHSTRQTAQAERVR